MNVSGSHTDFDHPNPLRWRVMSVILWVLIGVGCANESPSDILDFSDLDQSMSAPTMDADRPKADRVIPLQMDSRVVQDTSPHLTLDAAPVEEPPLCSEFLGQEDCALWSHCIYLWPGCAQENVRSLPLAFAGCVPTNALCPMGACSNDLTCQDAMIDPCPGEICAACGTSTQICLPPLSDTRCGGPENVTCAPGTYCEFDESAACGDADFGRCAPIPPPCDQPCRQVCGCDGQTYCNACTAAHRGMGIRHSGFCPPPDEAFPEDCIQMTHPDVRILGRGDACDDMNIQCPDGQRPYQDPCSCGCLMDAGARFACEIDADCVPEDCCRPTGCVAAALPRCAHDEAALCCFCGDCRAGVEACRCENGLCRTQFDSDVCE